MVFFCGCTEGVFGDLSLFPHINQRIHHGLSLFYLKFCLPSKKHGGSLKLRHKTLGVCESAGVCYSFKFGISSSQDAPVVTSTFRVSIFFNSQTDQLFLLVGKPTFVNLYMYIYWNRLHSLQTPWLFLVYSQNHRNSLPNIFCPKMWLPENFAIHFITIKTRPARNVPCAWNGCGNSRSLNVNKLSKRQGITNQQHIILGKFHLPTIHHQLGKATNLW